MTSEERREAHVEAAGGTKVTQGWIFHAEAQTAYDNLLAYLDEHQPLAAKLLREGEPEGWVADAIRYGLEEVSTLHVLNGEMALPLPLDERVFRINYPEGEQ